MRKTSIAAAMFGLSVSSAYGGSFETVAPLPESVVAAPLVDWSGAYVGAFGAYDFGKIIVNDVSAFGAGPRFEVNDIPLQSLEGGVLAGYNWQRGNIVFGLEADYSPGRATKVSLVDTIDLDEVLEWKTNWSASLRARIGFAKNAWLFYGTAGVSKINAEAGHVRYYDGTRTSIFVDGRAVNDYTGWSAGLGVEKMIGAHLVVRGEFIQSGYSEVLIPLVPGDLPIGYAPSTSTVRAAVIWRF